LARIFFDTPTGREISTKAIAGEFLEIRSLAKFWHVSFIATKGGHHSYHEGIKLGTFY